MRRPTTTATKASSSNTTPHTIAPPQSHPPRSRHHTKPSNPTSIPPKMGNTISTFVDKAIETVKNTFRAIAHPIVRYVVEHPIHTLSHVASGVLLLVPGVVTAPLLAVAGFGSGGIAAGEQARTLDRGGVS
jgi:hypothetical protein